MAVYRPQTMTVSDFFNSVIEPTPPKDVYHDSVTCMAGGAEMLRVSSDGFYVRGVKVEQGAGEAEAVYKAFKEFLTWAQLARP